MKIKRVVKIVALTLGIVSTVDAAQAADMNTPIASRPIALSPGGPGGPVALISVCYLGQYAQPYCAPEPQPATISLGQWCMELWSLPLPPGVTSTQFDQTPFGQYCFCIMTGNQC